jgi:hypothetical protein
MKEFNEFTTQHSQAVTHRDPPRTFTIGLVLLVAVVTIHHAGGATFTSFDVPNSGLTDANGMAPSGPLLIVGDYIAGGTEHGYLLSNGTFTTIDFPGSLLTQAFAVNANGIIVGDYAATNANGNGNSQHGYVLAAGIFTSIDFPGAAYTTAKGINSQGDIVSIYYTSVGNANTQYLPTGNTGHGFLLSGGTYTSIDFPDAILTEVWRITDGGQILGRYQSPADGKYHVFLFNDGVFSSVPDVPGSIETAPADISFGALDGAGDIVGDYSNQTPIMHKVKFGKDLHGFLLSGGVYTTIDFPGAVATGAWGTHSSGVIVGAYIDANNHAHAYIRTP